MLEINSEMQAKSFIIFPFFTFYYTRCIMLYPSASVRPSVNFFVSV